MTAPYQFPYFYGYPPYFTLQPVKETQAKQRQAWQQLILSYCKHHKNHIIAVDDFPLFANQDIDRSLSPEARRLFLEDLASRGNAIWLDKAKAQCLVLWRRVEEWADAIYGWARGVGMEEGVTTLDELSSGDDTRGTELEGLPRELLLRAIKVLEGQGKARLFKGAATDDEGVKFFTQ